MQDSIQLAGCVLTDDYGRLLLLHRYAEQGWWELPGGKVEEDEAPEEAAVREVREELGVSVSLRKALGRETFEYEGEQYTFHWYLGVVAAGEPQVMEQDKFDDVDYFEIEDLSSLSLSPNMLILENKILSGEVALDA